MLANDTVLNVSFFETLDIVGNSQINVKFKYLNQPTETVITRRVKNYKDFNDMMEKTGLAEINYYQPIRREQMLSFYTSLLSRLDGVSHE